MKFKLFLISIVLLSLSFYGLAVYWSIEPEVFNVVSKNGGRHPVVGHVTTNALIDIASTLLNKSGGYLSNDIIPPSVFMDNMPNWEFGVLVQIRDFAKVLRNDISRAQTQSEENKWLAKAEPHFNIDSKAWIFPSAEKEYRKGIKQLILDRNALSDKNNQNTQFFSRADNLRDYLKIVANRLGSLSQRLSASVGQTRINTDLAGEPDAQFSTGMDSETKVKTPWFKLDDIFYEARGTCWALIHLLKAIEIDFEHVLIKKNAVVSVKQIIRELESTQESMFSPMILNGSGFGIVVNHSLVMSSYIARANAGIIDLRDLLSKG